MAKPSSTGPMSYFAIAFGCVLFARTTSLLSSTFKGAPPTGDEHAARAATRETPAEERRRLLVTSLRSPMASFAPHQVRDKIATPYHARSAQWEASERGWRDPDRRVEKIQLRRNQRLAPSTGLSASRLRGVTSL